MNIDEAIIHAKEVANSKDCSCSVEHQQLAQWLQDYKELLQIVQGGLSSWETDCGYVGYEVLLDRNEYDPIQKLYNDVLK